MKNIIYIFLLILSSSCSKDKIPTGDYILNIEGIMYFDNNVTQKYYEKNVPIKIKESNENYIILNEVDTLWKEGTKIIGEFLSPSNLSNFSIKTFNSYFEKKAYKPYTIFGNYTSQTNLSIPLKGTYQIKQK